MSRKKFNRSRVKKLERTITGDGSDIVDFFLAAPSKFRLYFSINIKNKDLEILFDSGSGLSTINSYMLKLLNLEVSDDSTKTIRLINGGILVLNKSVVVNIEYKNIIIKQRLYLLEGTSETIILGMDFFEKVTEFPYDKEMINLSDEVNTSNEREFRKAEGRVTMTDI